MNNVDKQIILKVKEYTSKGLTVPEVALLAGVLESTVDAIQSGSYDHLLTEDKTDGVSVTIDYSTLKHLVACENAVEVILKNTKFSSTSDDVLFIHFASTFGILKAYVPEDVDRRLKELKELKDNREEVDEYE